MSITGVDDAGEPRAIELDGHPFFVGTAYQPERSALGVLGAAAAPGGPPAGQPHPLVFAFGWALCQ